MKSISAEAGCQLWRNGNIAALGRPAWARSWCLLRAGEQAALFDCNEAWLEQSTADMQAIGGKDCVLAGVAPPAVMLPIGATTARFPPATAVA